VVKNCHWTSAFVVNIYSLVDGKKWERIGKEVTEIVSIMKWMQFKQAQKSGNSRLQ